MQYLCKLRYVGTKFHGFQSQKGKTERTIQEEITRAAYSVFQKDCLVTGCSRTDSGVHANMFYCTIRLPNGETPIAETNIPLAFQAALPPDISIYFAYIVDDSFHPRHTPIQKTYVYKMHLSKVRNPFYLNLVWQIPFPVNVDKMKQCLPYLIGKKDFRSFMANGSKIEDTIREIYDASLELHDDILEFKVTADGFLYNMVRIMVGSLIEVGCGNYEPMDIEKIIEAKDRKKAGRTAPPEGLYLDKVIFLEYPEIQ